MLHKISLVYINHTKKIFLNTILLIDKALFLFALADFLKDALENDRVY